MAAASEVALDWLKLKAPVSPPQDTPLPWLKTQAAAPKEVPLPHLKAAPAFPAEKTSPLAKDFPLPAGKPQSWADVRQQARAQAKPATGGSEAPALYNMAESILMAPIGDVAGAVSGIRHLSPDAFYETREKVIGALRLPEGQRAQKLSQVMGWPIEKATTALKWASEKTLGKTLTRAISPLVTTATDFGVGVPAWAGTAKVGLHGIAKAGELTGRALDLPKLRDASLATQSIFSPTTFSADAKAAESVIRRRQGMADIEAQRQAQTLMQHQQTVGRLSVPEQRQMVDYIETGGKRGPLPDPKLQPAVNAVRKVYDFYKTRIGASLANTQQKMKFIDDYYVHMWKEKPQNVKDSLIAYWSRQGTGRNLKKRSIPTLADGIAAGLTPRVENPIDATMIYASNMSRYLATLDTIDEWRTTGLAKYYAPGKAPPGWTKLDGIKVDKPGRVIVERDATGKVIKKTDIPPMILYAPEGAARVYNNTISRGFHQGDLAPFWRAARATSNTLVRLTLANPIYHGVAETTFAMGSDFARAVQAASRGDFRTVGKAIAAVPFSAMTTALRGSRVKSELLGVKIAKNAVSQKINDAYVRAGGRIKMDRVYLSRGAGSFFDSLHRGTLVADLKKAGQMLAQSPLKGAADITANIMQTITAPIFEKYIPALKAGAFAKRMEDFYRATPNATQEEQDAFAIKLVDSMDNRFGEMIQDNLFWNKGAKQLAQIFMLSPTWTLSWAREFLGGLKDMGESASGIVHGKGVTDRTAYVVGYGLQLAMMNSMYQYLMTGKPPGSMRDLMVPQTGGTDVRFGGPERALLPGHEKEAIGFFNDFPYGIGPELGNKTNPLFNMVSEYATDKDYRGLMPYVPHDIKDMVPDNAPGVPGMFDDFIQHLQPISVQTMMKGTPRGSRIDPIQRNVIGVRQAPLYAAAPEKAAAMKKRGEITILKRTVKSNNKLKAQAQP